MMNLELAHQLIPGSVLVGNPSTIFTRVHTDTRSLQAGDLFVALKGESFDAHDFLAHAKQSGAVAALAQHGLQANGLFGLEVADSKAALGLLAKNWRAHLAAQKPIPVIAVTGSNGKTTLTQMIASILQSWQGDAALATAGNFNNDIGVPLTLLRLRESHHCAVVELGMNHIGEIADLAAMTAPTVAVVNNAQREHQEFMGTVEAVAQENGEVIKSLPASGIAVFPADDVYTEVWQELAGDRATLSFMLHPLPNPSPLKGEGETPSPLPPSYGESDTTSPLSPRGRGLGRGGAINGACFWRDGAWQITASTPLGELRYALHMAGKHNVKNSLAAVACAVAAGVPLSHIQSGLSAFAAVAGRSRTVSLKLVDKSITLVDDTYNANPDSVIAAIDMLMDLPAPRLLILGDMGEVGDQGPAFHAEVGAYAKTRGVDQFWTIGDLCQHAGGRHFADTEALLTELAVLVAPTPVGEMSAPADKGVASMQKPQSILIKGSRFMKMERVVKHIEGLSHAA
jgi:UDP-N-acetylmuramoyl-tripeptide--D-alanyl-D-alanine ligase